LRIYISSDNTLNNEIGEIFRKYNIIKYKSHTDNLTIYDFYKVCGYRLLYKSLSDKVNAIDRNNSNILLQKRT